MAAYTTYKWDKTKSYLVPAPELETFAMHDDPMTDEDLMAMDFMPKQLPIDHGDGEVSLELCYLDEEDPSFVYGPDDLRNYKFAEMPEDTNQDSDEIAKAVLNINLQKAVNSATLMMKSMYNFDLQSVEGIKNILQSLPMLDPDILKELAGQIWPGLDAQDVDPDQLRSEVRGYLYDYLEQLNAVDQS